MCDMTYIRRYDMTHNTKIYKKTTGRRPESKDEELLCSFFYVGVSMIVLRINDSPRIESRATIHYQTTHSLGSSPRIETSSSAASTSPSVDTETPSTCSVCLDRHCDFKVRA